MKKLILILLISLFLVDTVFSQTFSSPQNEPFGLDEQLSPSVFGKIYFADIDGDGDLDNFAPAYGNLEFAKNIGDAQNPLFANVILNPFGLTSPFDVNGMDFVDIDGDGDLDVYQTDNNRLIFYKNIGSTTSPSFEQGVTVHDVSNDLKRIINFSVTFDKVNYEALVSIDFVDIDNDGDFDLFAGGFSGATYFFRNIGSRITPSFAGVQFSPFGLGSSDNFQFNYISFVDIDLDGDFDAFIGAISGIKFYRNNGTSSSPSFQSQGNSPFGLVSQDFRRGAAFYDIDGDGDADAFFTNLTADKLNFQRNTQINSPSKIAQNITGFNTIPNQAGENYTISGVNGGASGNPIVFYSTDTTIATVSENVITLKNTGTCSIIATQRGNTAYNPASNIKQSLTVVDADVKSNQSIKGFRTIPFQSTAGGTYTITGVTGGASGFPVTYTSSNPSIASVNGNVISLLRRGVVTITASQAGNHLFNAAPDTSQTLTIGPPKTPQTISGFTSIPTLTVGQSYTITGVTGGASGNPIIFSVSNPNAASISGNIITALQAFPEGFVFVTASQAGNEDFEDATDITIDLVTTNGALLAQNISGMPSSIPKQRVGRTYTVPTLTGGASGNPVILTLENNFGIATISGNVITFLNEGTIDLVATQAGNSQYRPAQSRRRTIEITLDPDKGFQNILGFRLPEKLLVGNTYTISNVTAGGSGNPVIYTSSNPSVLSVSGNVVTANAPGRVTIAANQAGNGSFNIAPSIFLSTEVVTGLLPQTIAGFTTIPNLTVGDTYTITGVTGGESGNPVVFTSSNPAVASVTGNIIIANSTGSVTITASQLGNDNYLPATNVTQSLQVNAILLPQTIAGFTTIPNLTVGDTYTITGVTGGESGNPVVFTSSNPAVASVTGNIITANSTGSVTITASQLGNDTYLPATNVTQSLQVDAVLDIGSTAEQTMTTIYPNPSFNFIYIRNAPSNEFLLRFYNVSGMMIKELNIINSTSQEVKVDISDLRAGVYILSFGDNKGKFYENQKIIVFR